MAGVPLSGCSNALDRQLLLKDTVSASSHHSCLSGCPSSKVRPLFWEPTILYSIPNLLKLAGTRFW